MRLGFLIYGSLDTLSGGYFYDRQLVHSLRAAGHSLQVISLPWRNYLAHLSDNFTFRLPADLDLLIEDELNHPSLLAANRHKPYPVVSLVHHLRSSEQRPAWQNTLYRQVEKQYLRSVDAFLFNSQTTQNVVARLIGNSQPALLAYPPTDRFGPALPESLVLQRSQEPGPLRLVFLGSLIPRKGLGTLLKALALLPPRTARLDIIGPLTADPAHAAAMRQLSRRLGLEDRVKFQGPLNNEPLAQVLRQAQALVVPSSYEGFGIVYLEGMGFGLPAIGTSLGAAPEVIDDNRTGFVIAPGDSSSLAHKIETLQANRAFLAELSLNALARYQAQPSWQQTASQIHTFLLGLVS